MVVRCFVIPLFLFLFMSEENVAQQSIIVWGQVDSIPDVNIRVFETAYGTTTNEHGEYYLPVYFKDQIVQIHYSSIGYEDIILSVDLGEAKSDSIQLNLSLNKIDYLLEEVLVTAQADFFRIKNARIIGLQFLDNEMILLALENRKSKIIVIDSTGTPVLEKDLKNRYQAIHKDCFGYIELIGSDSCLQIKYDVEENELYLIDRFPAIDFHAKLEPCILEFENNILFTSTLHKDDSRGADQYHNKRASYFYVSRNDPEFRKKQLCTFYDQEAYQVAQSVYGEIIARYHQTTSESENIIEAGAWDGSLFKLMNNDPELFNLISWYLNIESKPIRIEVFKQKENLLFFDLVNYQLIKYDHSMGVEPVSSIQLPESEYKSLKSIIQDEVTEDIYCLYQRNGTYSLSEISTVQGEVSTPVQVSPLAFPDDITLFSGYVYIIYYDQIKRMSIISRVKLNVN